MDMTQKDNDAYVRFVIAIVISITIGVSLFVIGGLILLGKFLGIF